MHARVLGRSREQLACVHAGLDPLRQVHLVARSQQGGVGHLAEISADEVSLVVELARLQSSVIHREPPLFFQYPRLYAGIVVGHRYRQRTVGMLDDRPEFDDLGAAIASGGRTR
jgi:hypothetical protein